MSIREGKYKLFLDILECALEGRVPVIPDSTTPEEWEFLYATARRHAVQGLVYDSLENVRGGSIPPELAARWAMETVRLEKEYGKIRSLAGRQAAAWKEQRIGATMLKGLESAKYYAHPEHRVMGDIDWWFHTPADWDAALEFVTREGVKPEYDSDGDFHYSTEGIVTEHHRSGYETAAPCRELLLLNKHILHHAMVMGVGMRHICDYRAALRYFEGAYDPDEYRGILEEQGLTAWTEVLDTLPDSFLELILEDGNLGLDKKNRFSGFFRRALFFSRICPALFIRRWWSLVLGRLKRK